jgi:hypothetical protein
MSESESIGAASSLADPIMKTQLHVAVSPTPSATLYDEIFQLELDALLPASHDFSTGSTKVEQASREFQTKLAGPARASQPMPLAQPQQRPAAYVLMPFSMGPQDGWGNLLGKSRS